MRKTSRNEFYLVLIFASHQIATGFMMIAKNIDIYIHSNTSVMRGMKHLLIGATEMRKKENQKYLFQEIEVYVDKSIQDFH